MQKQFIKGLVTKAADGKYKVLASSAAIDRMGDSIDQQGWELDNFKSNPVMPWAHNYSELPVAKVTGLSVTDKGLEAEFEFAPAEGNPKAQQIKVLYDEGYLNAVSVGFIPKERSGNIITKAELLEISFVPVPANQEALKLAFKSLDTSELPELKGAIADEINAEEVIEQKYANWQEMCEIISALWTVYFDDDTSVDSFGNLLTEAIGLLQTLAANNGASDDNTTQNGMVAKAISPEAVAKFIAFTAKSGRTLSKKTLDSIDKSIVGLKEATAVLEQLKNASSDEDQDGNKGDDENKDEPEEEKVEEKEMIILSVEDVEQMRLALITNSKQNELGLTMLKNFLKNRPAK